MAERFFPFQSVNGDRRYSAEDWTSYFSSFVGNGVFPSPSTGLQVVSDSNMQIKVRAGKAWINGYFYENTAEVRKQIDYADGALSRIDRVVLRWDLGTRDIGIKIKKGTPSSNPIAAAPTRNTGVWELVLADILVNRGVLRITNADITDKRHDSTVCGIVASAVQQLDATGLFAQYDALFNNFLQNLQNNLSGDVAGNLLNKLNDKQNKMVMSDSDFIAVLTSNKTETDNAYLFMSRGDNGGSISGLGMTLYQALKNCETYTGYTIKYKSKPNAQEAAMNQNDFRNPAFYLAVVDKANKKKLTITPVGGNSEEIEEIREQVQQLFQSGNEAKQLLADALIAKGQIIDNQASFSEMAQKIRELKKLETIYIQRPVGRALKNKPSSPSVFSENYGTDYGFWRISNSSADTISNYAVITKPINLTNKSILFTGRNKNYVVGPDFCFYLTNNRNLLDEDYLKNIDKYTLESYLNENKKVYLGVYFDVSELSGDWYIVSFQKYSNDNIISKKIYLV